MFGTRTLRPTTAILLLASFAAAAAAVVIGFHLLADQSSNTAKDWVGLLLILFGLPLLPMLIYLSSLCELDAGGLLHPSGQLDDLVRLKRLGLLPHGIHRPRRRGGSVGRFLPRADRPGDGGGTDPRGDLDRLVQQKRGGLLDQGASGRPT